MLIELIIAVSVIVFLYFNSRQTGKRIEDSIQTIQSDINSKVESIEENINKQGDEIRNNLEAGKQITDVITDGVKDFIINGDPEAMEDFDIKDIDLKQLITGTGTNEDIIGVPSFFASLADNEEVLKYLEKQIPVPREIIQAGLKFVLNIFEKNISNRITDKIVNKVAGKGQESKIYEGKIINYGTW